MQANFYEVAFLLLHTFMKSLFHYYTQMVKNGKNSSKFSSQKFRNLHETIEEIDFMRSLFHYGGTQFQWITSKKYQNLHETIEEMDFMRSLFHYYRQITPALNRKKWQKMVQNAQKWKKCKQIFMKSLFHYYTHIWSKMEKMEANFYEVAFLLLHTFMKSLFHYYTKITPLENGGHTV